MNSRCTQAIKCLYKLYIAHGEKLDAVQEALGGTGGSGQQLANSSREFAHALRDPWSKYREIYCNR
jgi:hypothetical protein